MTMLHINGGGRSVESRRIVPGTGRMPISVRMSRLQTDAAFKL